MGRSAPPGARSGDKTGLLVVEEDMDLVTESSWALFAAGNEARDDFSGELPEATREEAVAGGEEQADGNADPDETLTKATLVSDDGHQAIVTASLQPDDGEDYDLDLQLVMENDGWRLDLVGTLDAMTSGLETDTTLPED